MKKIEIRQCEIAAYGKGYTLWDQQLDEPVYLVLYPSIPAAVKEVNDYNADLPNWYGMDGMPQSEWALVSICEPWPAEDDDGLDIDGYPEGPAGQSIRMAERGHFL